MDVPNLRPNRPKSRQSIAHVTTSKDLEFDKENATADLGSIRKRKLVGSDHEKKKSRSKSLGPGGIEALKESAGNAIKGPSASQIKSILKPTVPLTPPKVIPSFDETRKRSAARNGRKSPRNNTGDELLIDFSTPAPNPTIPIVTGVQNVVDPFSPIKMTTGQEGAAIALRTEEEQEAAAREKEAEEIRRAQKQLILDQRAARRKSMANRRVSFAPEATLHTWNVVEMVEDSTTSSASNSTRRQSSLTAAQTPNKAGQNIVSESDQSEPPSTPPEQVEEPLVKDSPANQQSVQQQRPRRPSSGGSNATPDMVNRNESSPASTHSGSSLVGDSSSIHVEDSIHSSSDEDGDTAMSMDEATGQTVRSELSSSSTGSSLDGRLQKAAAEAGTRGIGYDENGDDLSMELAEGSITNAFQPWVDNLDRVAAKDVSGMEDQENINPFSPAFKARLDTTTAQIDKAPEEEGTQGMTMDMTVAAGGILLRKQLPGKGRRKSIAPLRRRSSVIERRSSDDVAFDEGETMDFTVMDGGIVQSDTQRFVDNENSTICSNEEMTMEMTNVVGGVLEVARRESEDGASMDETMDMTGAIGSILPPIEERTEPQTDVEDNHTMDMDAPHVATSIASEMGSPSIALKPRLSGRKSASNRPSLTPRSAVQQVTPLKRGSPGRQGATPTKQVTPQPRKAQTPERTPVLPNVVYRGASPKKLFRAEIKAKASPASSQRSATKPTGLFGRDKETGQHTPSVVLNAPKPHQHLRRRSSGIGIDQEGLGSPQVSALLDRRRSIGDDATAFVPQPSQSIRSLRFDDVKVLEHEIDAEREEEGRRESGRFVMEQEADQPQHHEEENATLQLREMIESLTPKKDKSHKLKGRKSLHVGAAKGILGKRPAELDLDDDEDDVESTPKRLKVVERETSPVKRLHLPQPPSKDETTGRMTRAKRRSLDEITGNAQMTPTLSESPSKPSAAKTPQPKGRFRDISTGSGIALPTSFEDKLDNVVEAVDVSVLHDEQAPEMEKISLQEFLNMTNIHFIELSTTKRRHTLAPAAPCRPSQEILSSSNGACFAAAATTLPLLELYQHATRELKSYISSGRKIIRTIEQETLEEQPALFREYVDARPDVKMVMDNQFRNGKSNARLQSKAGWYAWRRQLVDGLRGGLEGIRADMENDKQSLMRQEEVLDDTVPQMVKHFGVLEHEAQMLQQRAEDFESVDHDSLGTVRAQLASTDDEVAEKMIILRQLQQQMAEKAEVLSAADELKVEFQDQISEAERVQDECRGWKLEDVQKLHERVMVAEEKSGWVLLTAEHEVEDGDVDFGPALTMRYRNALRLFFYPAAFQQRSAEQQEGRRSTRSKSESGLTAPISLTYAPATGNGATSASLTTQQRFFLQFLQGHLHALAVSPKGSVSSKTLLTVVSEGWDLAVKVSEEIRLLEIAGISHISILSDEKLGAKCMLLLPDRCRVDVQFTFAIHATDEGRMSTSVTAEAIPKYGAITSLLTSARSLKIREALNKQTSSRAIGEGSWVAAVRGFEEWVHTQKKGKPQEHLSAAKPEPEPTPTREPVPAPALPETPTRAPVGPKKELKRPVPIEEVMEEAAARQEETMRRHDEEMLVSATKTPVTHGRRPGALRRSP